MLISNAAQVAITAILDTSPKSAMEIYIDNHNNGITCI